MSGTNDTSFEASESEAGCPCGRSHAPQGKSRKRSLRKPEPGLAVALYEARLSGKAVQHNGIWYVHYSRDCAEPYMVSASGPPPTYAMARKIVRCRKCKPCLRARTNYWGFAAMQQTLICQGQGCRTWFGTLTLSPCMQDEFLARARDTSDNPAASYWDDPQCDQRFAAVRAVFLAETQRFWKRLRKKGHEFKYFLVFERHKSGLPHAHFLLHEMGKPITKRQLQDEWPFGFTNVSIVGGRSAKAAAPEKAAWYVVKYLSKSIQARQIASRHYRPDKSTPAGRGGEAADREKPRGFSPRSEGQDV